MLAPSFNSGILSLLGICFWGGALEVAVEGIGDGGETTVHRHSFNDEN